MQKEEFRTWLEEKGFNGSVARSRVGNCATVCNYEGDLDQIYQQDQLNDLLNRLNYTTEDERQNSPCRHRVPINGNKRTGSATLKTAVKLYKAFLENQPYLVNAQGRVANQIARSDWPRWETPSDEEALLMAKAMTKYMKFLSPEIVARIVEDNINKKDFFIQKLTEKNIDPELYLWDGSACCFPGIRRYKGSQEIAAFRGHAEINQYEDALDVDDNDYPKQIWSFLFTGRQFNKKGPQNYSLAHLIDHKKDNNRMEKEFIFSEEHPFEKPFYGLYTCASNAVYTPESIIRLTDFNTKVRNMLFHKVYSLYKDYCNIIPGYISLSEIEDHEWNIENFEWAAPVGSMDNINAFLEFRYLRIEQL